MGLTRPRAHQIYDIDYKQSVRVITVTNVTLSGGAPNLVDSVNLSLGDRILVTGQSTGSQNGLYQVSVLGTGNNGTWIRSTDSNETGELSAGTIVMVTEGDIYKDTQWKLTTNDPITIGSTALVFEQNSAFAYGNIFANGTPVIAGSVGDTLTLTAGNNISITGNATAKSVTIGVTGISLNSISNGTSNVNVVASNGNVTFGINGTSNVLVVTSGGIEVAGNLTVTGNTEYTNVTTLAIQDPIIGIGRGANNSPLTTNDNKDRGIQYWYYDGAEKSGFIGWDDTAGRLIAAANVTITNDIVSSVDTFGAFEVGNLTSESINSTGNIIGGNLNTAGNITGNFILGNGSQLSGINSFSNIAVTAGNTVSADSIADTLTLTAGSGITIVADSANDSITIALAQSGSNIFVNLADFGLVTQAVTVTDDLGSVTETATVLTDLEFIVTSGVFYPTQLVLPPYTVMTLPSASPSGQMIFVSDESGGAVPAFSDGTNWRRVTDRAIVS